MPWVRLDDAFYDNAKFSDLTNAAVGVWVKLLAFASRNLTDGNIRKAFANRLASRKELTELVGAGLIEQTEDGWLLHDFLDFQPAAAVVVAQREALSAERAAAGRKGGIATANGKQSPSNLVGTAPANGQQMSSPVPDPVPIPKEVKDLFPDFWMAYPRKLGKPEAQKAWLRALRKTSAETIIASLPAWCASWTDPRFIPHPSTWLNREQWNDAPVTPAGSGGGTDLEVARALAKYEGAS